MPDLRPSESGRAAWRDKWHEVIFGHETSTGRVYDMVLITSILLSVLFVLLESVRIAAATGRKTYVTSFYGIVDLVAVAPIYLSVFFSLTHSFTVVPSLRLVRIFRILKLAEYITSIPAAMYWAIVTVTTVGYGDISPHTVTGRMLA